MSSSSGVLLVTTSLTSIICWRRPTARLRSLCGAPCQGCHVAVPSQPTSAVSLIISPPSCPVESFGNAKTRLSSSPSLGLHPEPVMKGNNFSSDTISFFSSVSKTSGQEKCVFLPNLANVFPWDWERPGN